MFCFTFHTPLVPLTPFFPYTLQLHTSRFYCLQDFPGLNPLLMVTVFCILLYTLKRYFLFRYYNSIKLGIQQISTPNLNSLNVLQGHWRGNVWNWETSKSLVVIRKTLLTLLTHLYDLNTLAGTYLHELSLTMQYWVCKHHHYFTRF